MRQLRLAVLLCDEIVMRSPRIIATFGDYAKIFHQYLTKSLEEITSEVTFTLDGYDVVDNMEYPPEGTHYDGILISGSRTSVNDDLPWVKKLVAYVQHLVSEKQDVKLFGICFGHQIITQALGGDVKRGNWEISVRTIDLTRVGRALFRAHNIHLQLFHHDEVTACAPHAHRLGSSDIAANQGTVIFDPKSAPSPADLESDGLRVDLTSIHVLTLQGHPEFTEKLMLKLIEEDAKDLPQDLVDDAVVRAGLPTDAIGKLGVSPIAFRAALAER